MTTSAVSISKGLLLPILLALPAVGLISSDALASLASRPGLTCQPAGTGPAEYSNSTIRNPDTENWLDVTCPVRDDWLAAKGNIYMAAITVDDRSADHNVIANACVTYYNAIGGACGGSSSTSGTGTLLLNPQTSAVWNTANAAHFGYWKVQLPPNGLSFPHIGSGIVGTQTFHN